jgi:hypothetical protein
MRQDKVSKARELSQSDLEAFSLNSLIQYARAPRFEQEATDAFNFYWGGVYDLNGLQDVEAEDVRRTIEWLNYDRRLRDGHRIVDLFIEDEMSDLPPEAQTVLKAWSHSVMGLFRVVRLGEGIRLGLYDCLRGVELEVESALLSRNARPGDLLIGRQFELDGEQRLSSMTMILPGEYESSLVEYVTNAFALYRDEHPQASWDEFLRENGHIFNAFLLSSKAEALRSLIGPGTRFRDPAVSRDRLHAFTAQRSAERQREAREAGRERPPEHRTASGIILPGQASAEAVEQKEGELAKPIILVPGRDT